MKSHHLQRRFAPLSDVSIDASSRTFRGYASVFGVVDSYGTAMAPGAFAASLANWKKQARLPDFCLMHDQAALIGKFLEMREDARGLYVEGAYVNSALGDHALALLNEGIASGLSIGFVPRVVTQESLITMLDLYEVSQVSNPSNREAEIFGRTIHAGSTRRDIERALIGVGIPRDAAKRMAMQWHEGADLLDAARDVHETIPTINDPSIDLAQALMQAAGALKG